MATVPSSKFSTLTTVASSTAAVASGLAIAAVAIESIPFLAVAGAVALASGVIALSAGTPKKLDDPADSLARKEEHIFSRVS